MVMSLLARLFISARKIVGLRKSSVLWGNHWVVEEEKHRIRVEHTEARIEVLWSSRARVEEGGRSWAGYRLKVRMQSSGDNVEERWGSGKQKTSFNYVVYTFS